MAEGLVINKTTDTKKIDLKLPIDTKDFWKNIKKLEEKNQQIQIGNPKSKLIPQTKQEIIDELKNQAFLIKDYDELQKIASKLKDYGIQSNVIADAYPSSQQGVAYNYVPGHLEITSEPKMDIVKEPTKDIVKEPTKDIGTKTDSSATKSIITSKASQLPPELQQAYIQLAQGENKDFGVRSGDTRKTGWEAVANAIAEGAINTGLTGLNKAITSETGKAQFMNYILPAAERIYGTKFTELSKEDQAKFKDELLKNESERNKLMTEIKDIKSKQSTETIPGREMKKSDIITTEEIAKNLRLKGLEGERGDIQRKAQQALQFKTGGYTPAETSALNMMAAQMNLQNNASLNRYLSERNLRYDDFLRQLKAQTDAQATLMRIGQELQQGQTGSLGLLMQGATPQP